MKKILILLSLFLFSSSIFSQEGIVFRKETFNFTHVLRDGGIVKYRFNFKNKTKGTVQILSAYTDCNFISLDWFRPSIDREEKAYIQVILDPSSAEYGEYIEKIIVFTSADEDSPIILTIMCNIVDKIPEPVIEPYLEYFGAMADNGSLRSKKYVALIESIANYVIKKGDLVLQVESSMSPMSIANYSKKIAKSRAENIQTEIIKSVTKYNVNSSSVTFLSPKIVIQGPEYSKKTQGKSKECGKFQYVKIIKK